MCVARGDGRGARQPDDIDGRGASARLAVAKLPGVVPAQHFTPPALVTAQVCSRPAESEATPSASAVPGPRTATIVARASKKKTDRSNVLIRGGAPSPDGRYEPERLCQEMAGGYFALAVAKRRSTWSASNRASRALRCRNSWYCVWTTVSRARRPSICFACARFFRCCF